MGDFFQLNNKIKIDEEKKYKENEGFMEFLKKQA